MNECWRYSDKTTCLISSFIQEPIIDWTIFSLAFAMSSFLYLALRAKYIAMVDIV